ncbi:metal-binding protein [Methanococcoides orientis]|uniref:metal-binding protein n=1 Tax=Methanococcoides orientis TaxID=2822137 RepID=UPI001E311B08|nr:metal-binding protein [Methanococcoides orientis]UGV41393.1 metal-binding protein [Methanococcoides orientis]
MPDAKTHDTINIAVMLVILASLSYLTMWKENEMAIRYLDIYMITIFSISYLFATFFLSPDLDIESKPYKRWKIFKFLWWPYKVIFKHRGFSHNPIIGPLSIIINLALIVALLFLIIGVDLHKVPLRYIIVATAGMCLSMEVHIISDSLISKAKSYF